MCLFRISFFLLLLSTQADGQEPAAHQTVSINCPWVQRWDTIPCNFAIVSRDSTGQLYRINPDTLYCKYRTRVCTGSVRIAFVDDYVDPIYYLKPDDPPVDLVMFASNRGYGIQFVTDPPRR